MPIRFSIVDEDDQLRLALRHGLAALGGFVCAGCYQDAGEALIRLPNSACDVVLMETHMAGWSGIDYTRRLKDRRPRLRVIILSSRGDEPTILRAFLAGADGYLIKPVGTSECANALREVICGGAPMAPPAARLLVRSFHGLPAMPREKSELSPRERELMACLLRERCDQEIAEELGISEATVRTQMHALVAKLGVANRTQVVAHYLTGMTAT